MDFDDTAAQKLFRAEIREWLSNNATPKGAGEVVGTLDKSYELAKIWYKKVADAGYACLTWPQEYGGAGLSQIESVIWSQEVAGYDEPDGYFVIGQGNCGPALMALASEEEKRRLLPRMASAEDVWCQLFSEPGAGSDVAGLRTRAEQTEGGSWRLNGQKIWTSQAQHSQYGVVLCRTDPTVSKYRGLTMFYIDMEQPGVEVRPIVQMDGGQHFNEVYFNDAEVPDAWRLGDIGGGWSAALTVLMNERLAISGVQPNGFPEFLDFCLNTVLDDGPVIEDPILRDRLADWYCKDAGLRNANSRMLTAVAKGGIPGAEASLGKLVGAVMNQEIANFTMQLLGQSAAVCDDELAAKRGHFQKAVLFSPGIRLAGGTDEVMRNIIAEQVLGLPQEPRADKGIPFCDIPGGQ
jgi:alkylation response protein AidB-like acyl-CoA dehydrogenase